MKNAFTTICLFLAMTSLGVAQNTEQVFNLRNVNEADLMLKAISLEVELSAEQFAQVRDLLYASAKNTAEVLNTEEGKKADAEQNIVIRQNAHVETNLQTILGEDKFTIYLGKKGAIEKRFQEMRNN